MLNICFFCLLAHFYIHSEPFSLLQRLKGASCSQYKLESIGYSCFSLSVIVSEFSRRTGHITAFSQELLRCLSIKPSFSVTSANIAISDTSLKTRFFGLHFRRRKYWCIFNYFYVIGPEIYRMRHNNGHYAVQGHSRSPILVPIESSYGTSH